MERDLSLGSYIAIVLTVHRRLRNKRKNLQSLALQIPLLNKSLDLTLSQYALQDRTLVLFPSPHVLLQDDHLSHEVYSGGPEKTVFLLIYLLMKNMFYMAMVVFVHRGTKCHPNNLQSTALQTSLLNKSLDLTLSQYALQDRTFVLSPLPHVLLQDDHSPHE